MMTMKEACAYVAQKRKTEAKLHRENVTNGDYCNPLTAKEYRKVKVKAKGTGARGRKFAHTKLWNHYNVPVR